MAWTTQVVDAAKTSTIVELHGSASTDIKTIRFSPGAPVVYESWFQSPDAPDGVLAKAQDRVRSASLSLVIPRQANFAALRTKVEAVIDAFAVTGYWLKMTYSDDVTRYHYLYASRLAPPFDSDAAYLAAAVNLMVPRWDFQFSMRSTADGRSRYDAL
jgi:hypothetical protein